MYFPDQLRQDFAGAFNSFQPGESRAWNQGTLTFNPNRTFNYVDPTGQSLQFGQGTDLNTLYQNPYIQKTWDMKYGLDHIQEPEPIFEIPENIGGPTSNSSNSSYGSSQSSSWKGINWDDPAAGGVLNPLLQSAQGLPGLVDQMGQTLQGQYSNLMQQAMGPQGFQGTLNQMGGRNMLNSSVMGDALSKAQATSSQAIANQAFNSQLAQQQAKMQVPGLLSQVAGLGQQATSSASGTTRSSGEGSSTDPLAQYRLLAGMLPTLLNYGIS